jgi:tyrocidine synthetase-3
MHKIDKKNIEDILALTPLQEGMLFHYLKEPQSNYYFEQLSLLMSGKVDPEAFEEAWNFVVKTNEMLRTIFRWEKLEKPVQIVLKEYRIKIKYRDLSMSGSGERQMLLEEIKSKDKKKKFDLREVPFRVTLCKLSDDTYEMILSNHHILYDGWSNGILLNEFFHAYNAFSGGQELDKPVKNRFKEFIQWCQTRDTLEQEKFWKDYLMGSDFQAALSVKKRRNQQSLATAVGNSGNYKITFPKSIKDKIHDFARKYKVTLAALLYSAWGILLQKYNDSTDIVFGTTVSGRTVKVDGVEDMVGLFINTIPFRVQTDPVETVEGLLYRVDTALQKREEYEQTPLVNIREYSRTNNNEELFDTIVIIENYPLDRVSISENSRLTVESFVMEERTHYDLTVGITVFDRIEVNLSYNGDSLDEESIERLSHHFKSIIWDFIGHPDKRVTDIEIISPEEKDKILYEFNNTGAPYSSDKTIHQIFEEQVEKSPDRTALIFRDKEITYRVLDDKADQLAKLLMEKGTKPGAVAALMVERSIEMITGILAVLKAGGAYLPLDPGYPEERMKYIFEDSHTQMLLTQRHLVNLVNKAVFKGKVIEIDIEGIYNEFRAVPGWEVAKNSRNPAYIIYTSGSTGKPKGVMVEHHSLLNLLNALQRAYPFNDSDTYLLKTSYVFDVSLTELFGWFLGGGRLALLEKDGEKDPREILDAVNITHTTHINFVPSMFNVFVDELEAGDIDDIKKISTLKYIFLAGEALLPGLVKKFRSLKTGIPVENLYGPTEATVYASKYSSSQWNEDGNIPIGKPFPNMKLYILNKDYCLQPVGVPGELCIAETGLARGYVNNPVLTAEKFLPNPFSSPVSPVTNDANDTNDRFYRTGDLARWLVDGNIEFLGRIDNQVKIRGFRIEPGEIENQLLKHEELKEVVVAVKEDKGGDCFLAAYYVPLSDVPSAVLREYLSRILPDYMIPNYFMQLNQLPLTPTGKVNRRALPTPEGKVYGEYIAPGNEIEKALADIWSDVLDREKGLIGIEDNFFQLGGHSLKATTMVARIHKIFNIKLPLAELFKCPTIKGLSEYIKGTVESGYISIEIAEEKEYYTTSSAQKRLYFLYQMDELGTVYNMSSAWILEGGVDKKWLEKIFGKLIQRHQSLRTSFEMIDGEPVQRIGKAVDFEIEYICRKQGAGCREEKIKNFVRPFDLSNAPLIRVGLEKIEDQKYILMVDMHHIISDGVSTGILVQDFMRLYIREELPGMSLQYRDYAEWQNREKKGEDLLEQGRYWKKEFEGEIPVLDLPTDYIRPAVQSYEGDRISFEMEKEFTGALKTLALEEEVSLYMMLLAIYYIFLSKISSSEDIVIGAPTAGRRHADLDKIIGIFVSTLALRNSPAGEKRFGSFLAEVKEKTLCAFENQEYQYEDLVEQIVVNRDISRNPIFDVSFLLQNTGFSELKIPGMKLTSYEFENPVSKFSLTLIGKEMGGTLKFHFHYCTKLFKPETVERFSGYFKNLVLAVIEDKNKKISELELMTGEEKQQIISNFNNTEMQYPQEERIPALFEWQVKKSPDNIAVLFEDKAVTYRVLDEKANQMANFLIQKGLNPGTTAALMLERSLGMITGILAVLKAGGTYLPIEPEYPEKRIRYIFEDSDVRVLLTQNHLLNKTVLKGEIIDIDNEDIYMYSGFSTTLALEIAGKPRNPAYIIYTSGSTGKPKGVLIEHSSVVNLAWSQKKYFDITEYDRILQFSSICFDASVEQIFIALFSGAVLVLVDKNTLLDKNKFEAFIASRSITHLHTVPSFLNQVKLNATYALKRVISGGDVCPLDLAKRLIKYTNFYNEYGPTETTITSIELKVADKVVNGISPGLPIGTPISNTSIYLLDKWMKPVPPGTAGELYIGGEGVSRGYLNRPELTAEKFILDPFSSPTANEGFPARNYRLYRTGDLARWLPDGNIDFIGRIDHQIKIRGFRIETGEIENQLLEHKEIKEAVVMVREDSGGDRCLTAYYVSDIELPGPILREYLLKILPDYMIPTYFMQLDQLPLIPTTGKVDRRTLPTPEGKAYGEYIAPGNETEKALSDIWSAVLGREKELIGIEDNFSQLGGHSLKATALATMIHKIFNIKISLVELFKRPTIREQSEYIKRTVEDRYISIEKAEKREYYKTSSAQKRLYFLQQMDELGTAYNMSSAWVLEGKIDKNRLEKALRKLIQRHQSLRTFFEIINGEPVQLIGKEVDFEIEHYCTESGGEFIYPSTGTEQIIRRFIRPFDLSRSPLLRVGLIKKEFLKYIIMVDMHHIISDGMSVGIFVKEFSVVCAGIELPVLEFQYKDFSQWEYCLKTKKMLKKQEEFWLKEFPGEIPLLDLPADFARPTALDVEGGTLDFIIGKNETEKLRALALKEDSTLYMVLLSLFNILLSKLSGREDIVVGSPIAGRRHIELEKIIGMFVNTLVLRNYPSGDKTFNVFLREVKERTLAVFANQEYPFENLVEKVAVSRDIGRNPLFDVMFILQNIDTPEIKIPGLELTPYEFDNRISRFDLTLLCEEKDDRLFFIVEYRTKLFKETTIKRFIDYFKKLVVGIPGNPDIKISSIELMSEEEKRRIIYDFNDTNAEYPNGKVIHEIFEEQVERTPSRISLLFKNEALTYRELNEKVNQLSGVLREKGAEPGAIIGLMLNRSVELIIGIMAILKAGCAYLPIEPAYPEDRINYLLADSNTGILVTGENISHNISFGREIIYLGGDNMPHLSSPSPGAVGGYTLAPSHRSPVAYVIYTSGSTGKPKGVMIDHPSLVNRLNWMQRFYPIGEQDVILQKTSIVFDVSVWELFWWSLQGAAVCLLAPGDEKSPEAIIEAVEKNKVTTLHFVPSMLNAFLEYLEYSKNETSRRLSSLRQVFASGEVLGIQQARKFNKFLSTKNKTKLINLYGPTETTIDVSYFNCSPDQGFENGSIPIGKPIDNIHLYVVNKETRLQPVGVVGELCIAGLGLARGYLNRPELTADKFVECLLPSGERLYKTGDLTRWLPDGNIEFLGRIDQQVKIRGFRIELEEIESILFTHEKVKEAVVAVKETENGNKFLCGYIVPRHNPINAVNPLQQSNPLELSELREHLAGKLPDYMIPSFFVLLEELPLTPSGKLNRRALTAPGMSQLESETRYAAPRDAVELALSRVWENVLGRNKIGIYESFFEIGGDSIKSIQIASRMNKLGYKVEMKDIFHHPRIADLAPHVRELEEVSSIVPGENENLAEKFYWQDEDSITVEHLKRRYLVEDIYPLTPIQEGMLLHSLIERKTTPLLTQFSYRLQTEVNVRLVERSINELFKRYDIFRTIFVHEGLNRPLQVVLIERKVDFCYRDIRKLTPDEKETFAKDLKRKYRTHWFDLTKDVLMRVSVIRLEDSQYEFTWSFHHILMDGWCIGIFISEYLDIYQSLNEGRDYRLPEVTPYKNYIRWLEERDKEKARNYWKNYLNSYDESAALPRIKTYNEGEVVYKGEHIVLESNREDTNHLIDLAIRNQVTLNTVMQCAWGIILGKYTGRRDVVFGTVVSGRPSGLMGVESMMGLFINTIPVRIQWEGTTRFNDLLKKVQENALDCEPFHHYPLVKIQSETPLKNHLLDHILVLENFPITERLKNLLNRMGDNKDSDSLEFSHLESFGQSNYDFNIVIITGTECLKIDFSYNGNEFEKALVEHMAEQFKRFIMEILKDETIPVDELNLISKEREWGRLKEMTNETNRVLIADRGLNEAAFEHLEAEFDF